MMTWTNILKKAVNFGLVGVVAGMVLLNAGIAEAATGTITLKGKEACKKTSSLDVKDTCKTVAKMQQAGSTSALATQGTECTTGASSCKNSSIQSVSYYNNRDRNNCFNSVPLNGSGTISSVVGMRPTSIGASSGTCYQDPNTGVKMRQHAGMDVSTACNTPIQSPADGKISGVSWHCSGSGDAGNGQGAGNYVVIQHPLNPNDNDYKNNPKCKYYYTRFFHLSDKFKPILSLTVKQGTIVGYVGGTNCGGSAYSCHMHMELHKCSPSGKLLNPLCSSNQNLCNGAEAVNVTSDDPAVVPQDGYSSGAALQLEDCSKYKTENIKAAALAKCEAELDKIPSPARTPEILETYNKCKAKADADAITNMLQNQTSYEDCEKRNQEKKLTAGDSSSPWGEGGGTFTEFQSNYQCNIAENFVSIQGCIFCDLFKIIFNTASAVAKVCHKIFADSMIKLLTVCLAIWLAWLVMKYVSDMTVKDPGMMLNEIFRKIFVVAFIILLLSLDVSKFFEIFVSPVFNTGFTLASLAMDNATIGNWDVDGSGLPASMGNSMLSAINAIQERLQKLMALGSNAICTALFVKSYNGYPIFPHFGYLLTGLFLWLIALVFMLCYPFLLIDSVLQFTIASALFPVALASTAFKITYNYLNIFKVIQIFMNAMFVFIFLTIVLFILLAGIDDAVKPIIDSAYEASASFFSLDTLVWYSKVFVKLVFFLFLGKAVLEDIPSFAEKFSSAVTLGQGMSSADLGAGRNLGGLAVGAATRGATQLGAPALSAGISGVRTAGKATSTIIKGARYNYLLNRTQNKVAAAGLGAGAVVTGRDFLFRKVSRKVVQNPDGSLALESSRKGMFNKNNTYTSRQNETMSIKTKVDALGVKKESYDIKSAFSKSLINKDGTRNEFAVNNLLQSSGLTENEKNKVILNQMLKQRMPRSNEAHLEGGFLKEEIINSKDAQGRSVFQVRRVDKDGNIQVFSMTKGDSRDLIEYEKISKDGKAVKWSSDGILQKKDTYQYDMNKDKSFLADNQVTINGAEVKDTQVSANGTLLDKDGNALGAVQANGNIVDANGNVIGTATTPQLAFDKNGLAIGKITADGMIVDDKGNVTATISEDGVITDKQGRNILGQISDEQRASCYNAMKIKKGSRKVEFSHSKAFKGCKIFDDDGNIEEDMQDEELMFGQSDLELYQMQMKKYGDVLQHNRFGR